LLEIITPLTYQNEHHATAAHCGLPLPLFSPPILDLGGISGKSCAEVAKVESECVGWRYLGWRYFGLRHVMLLVDVELVGCIALILCAARISDRQRTVYLPAMRTVSSSPPPASPSPWSNNPLSFSHHHQHYRHIFVLQFLSDSLFIPALTMASYKLFKDVPPFPEDVATMPMRTISLADLRSGAQSTAQEVLLACQDLGFFLLALQGDELGDKMIEEIDELFDVGKDIMNLPDEVKQEYLHDIPKSFLGYVAATHEHARVASTLHDEYA
jgi:hypothetical protein